MPGEGLGILAQRGIQAWVQAPRPSTAKSSATTTKRSTNRAAQALKLAASALRSSQSVQGA